MEKKHKLIALGTAVIVVLLSVFAVAMAIIPLINGPGVKTEALDASDAKAATTDINGTWEVIYGKAPNISSAGFTFYEVLPAEKRVTSGSTQSVTGTVEVKEQKIVSGKVAINMADIRTDNDKRDNNVRAKIFEVEKYPEATFETTGSTDVSSIPEDGTTTEITIPGKLTIHGKTNTISPSFTIVRDADTVKLSSTIPINRLDYDVNTPEFVAAKIDTNGEINVLLTLKKN
ncbi:hypothetical protein AY498_00295 [Corynebacterium ulcerans]|uniref:Protein yceI n=3 Tax=Corynebacterium TaxID=1716 RepID=A0ABD7MS24_CORUL|nr:MULTISPECIES: YceI family protein [Corynebacterium]AEG81605.1 putative secreted protein [Corynebacterium ulcerans 809]AIT89073.1 Hypothetical protein Cul210932_1126 [Corynebacterium ulcerans]AIU30422.1 Hypothetical protein Cul210931_1078 [Corynebacterium ulcerans]AIU32673.1 Hypothetical protein CulFRC11_1096 [Corynebacterium ramonii FRC0011]AIU91720.1 Hypothetical protein Cul05146_1152 [Corynebacterium ulcerans]